LVKGLGLPVSNDVVMTIGGHPGGAAHAFAGAVDDMAIFTKVLSADEIKGGIKWIDGAFGKALEFDGKTGLATIAKSEKLNFGDDFSVVFWARTTQVRAKNADWWMGGWIINKDMGGTNRYYRLGRC